MHWFVVYLRVSTRTGSSCLRVVMSRLPGLRKSRPPVTAAAVAAAFAANGNASTSLSGAEGYRQSVP